MCATEPIDGIFFGPADIAADFGKLGQPEDAEVWRAITTAAKEVRSLGNPVGTPISNPETAIDLLNDGFSFVARGTDAGLFAKGAQNLLGNVRSRTVCGSQDMG
ncbi:aldolase/citrate lyase family protein [Defluviimonas sp. WL0024]|uniref:Aldolase/citrate lyase family protein n=1 Tax=Albidovulum salinarum TaxID=2984153 RepID=A0ABT2X8S6_9RHOB|nr:aldolase/citrate lyase family protein [Defluviimonas sp. WL0024]